MKSSSYPARSISTRQAGFSLVEMIGVLAIIAILAVVIVPKVFSTIASSRVTSAVGSVNTMRTAVTEFGGKYGTFPLTVAASRIDDLLITTGILDSRFTTKIGTQPGATPIAGATWNNTSGTWVAVGGTSQATQSRIICLASAPTAAPGAGTNYRLDGSATGNLPAGARVVSAVLTGVSINDARDLSLKIDGETLTQPTTSVAADVAGKVTYAAPATAAATVTVYVYLASQ
jgi:prepilin-type N-terminal cleavage/methylation domain-containing protein